MRSIFGSAAAALPLSGRTLLLGERLSWASEALAARQKNCHSLNFSLIMI
jgi:hypothetical protein